MENEFPVVNHLKPTPSKVCSLCLTYYNIHTSSVISGGKLKGLIFLLPAQLMYSGPLVHTMVNASKGIGETSAPKQPPHCIMEVGFFILNNN